MLLVRIGLRKVARELSGRPSQGAFRVQGTPEERERVDFMFLEEQVARRLGVPWAWESDACVFGVAQAISDLTGQHPQLDRYAVKAITGGTDAQGEVTCLLREDGHTVTGQGSHTDIIQASALAYVNALNKLEYRRQFQAQRQQAEVGP